MAEARIFRDLQWLQQAIESPTLMLRTISFHLSRDAPGCYLEKESTMTVHISNDTISDFSCILEELAAGQYAIRHLRSLEFIQVKWLSDQLHCLVFLLEKIPSITRLNFHKNSFTVQLLSQISECLKSCLLKEVVFSRSHIGPQGAKILASALASNGHLEGLKIWEDSIGSKGAHELAKMTQSNSSLRMLNILDSDSTIASPLISAVLARNRLMEVHVWTKEEGENSGSNVAEFIPVNSVLRILQMNVSGSCRVASSLCLNLTVTLLDMTGVRLKSRWAKLFQQVLEQNQTLKEANLSHTYLKDKGAKYIAAGLFKNQSLETLRLHGNFFTSIGIELMLCPLSRYSSEQIQANTMLKSITFGGENTQIGRDGLAAILRFLTTNQIITFLGIYEDRSLEPEYIISILKCLEENTSLIKLSFQGCQGVRGELVKEAITELSHTNPSIEGIDIVRTPLHTSGNTYCQKLGRNLGTETGFEVESEITSLEYMPSKIPKSCRIFVCGREHSGKNSLFNSIAQNFSTPSHLQVDQVKNLKYAVDLTMKIKTFNDEETKMSFWNIHGQHELYSLREHMFPGNGTPFFIIMSSLFSKPNSREPKIPFEIAEDIHYWLRFIVSNSRRASQRCFLPNVTLVLTHFDRITQPWHDLEAMMSLIEKLNDKFREDVDVFPSVFTVDARSPSSVRKLSHHLHVTKNTILQRGPQISEICDVLIQILAGWRAKNQNQRIMKWKEFNDLCQVEVPSLRAKRRGNDDKNIEQIGRGVAMCLHNTGEIIYFEELGFLILDIEWFCYVISQLFQLEPRRPGYTENGFISRKELERILLRFLQSNLSCIELKTSQILHPSDLARMMMKMELCYEQDPSNPDSRVLIPSLLGEGKEKPQWPLSYPNCIFLGRRFECEDSSNVFFIPPFFPRLQVNLHNKIKELKSQHGATCTLEKHLISLNLNDINFRVELGGQIGHYIDIIVCSSKNVTETLRLLNQLIVPAIHSGCNGIALTENIIRPECAQYLLSHRYRKSQLVPLQHLKEVVLSMPADTMYDYKHAWNRAIDSGRVVINNGFDLARDLLSDDDFWEILHQRYCNLYDLAEELEVPLENDTVKTGLSIPVESGSVEASLGGIAKGVEVVLQRLNIIEQEIKNLKQEIQGLRHYEHKLLIQLHQKVDYLVNFSAQVEERKVPNMFYFVQTGNYTRRLVTIMIAGMTMLRLHMLCEFRREMHVVGDQVGFEIMQIESTAVRCLAPYMKKFMKLLTFALRIGAQLAAGMGHMIPDLSREIGYLMGSSMAYGGGGVAAGAAGAAGVMAARNIVGNSKEGNILQDVVAAQQWIIDFLREKKCSGGKDIAEKFGLWRVRYRDDGQIAWICRRHMYSRMNEIIEVPI